MPHFSHILGVDSVRIRHTLTLVLVPAHGIAQVRPAAIVRVGDGFLEVRGPEAEMRARQGARRQIPRSVLPAVGIGEPVATMRGFKYCQ